MESIKIAAAHIGSMAEMARQLGVSKQSVSFWRDGLRTIPAGKCPDIERCTGGLVTCEQLRPDVNWAYLRGTNCPPAVRTSPAINAA